MGVDTHNPPISDLDSLLSSGPRTLHGVRHRARRCALVGTWHHVNCSSSDKSLSPTIIPSTPPSTSTTGCKTDDSHESSLLLPPASPPPFSPNYSDIMDRARKAFGGSRRHEAALDPEYQPLTASDDEPANLQDSTLFEQQEDEPPFSWMEYSIFVLLGIAMLWAWNMFLAAAPYFASRIAGDPWLEANFQSSILAVSTITNLAAMLVLTNIQHSASYPLRINLALAINMATFSLLTVSTVAGLHASPRLYFAFVLAMVAVSAWATGLVQNGAFAFAASFGRPEYMQALMAGQGVAGVLPPLAQVSTVLLYPPPSTNGKNDGDGGEDDDDHSSAFLYFLAAVTISLVTLIAIIPLHRRHNRIIEARIAGQLADSVTSVEEAERAARKTVPLTRLFLKLRWLALALSLTFAETMFFPVFTSKITSVNDGASAPAILRPEAFIPLAFFFWNLGDLSGRVATILPFTLRDRPPVLFALAVARAAMIPLYLLCNIGGRGALVPSDFFYLAVVQLLYGLSNGWLGSSCMMASGDWVDDGEREVAGGFMGLCLVVGLATGSILSFSIAGV